MRGTVQQLHEIQIKILAAGPLGSEQIEQHMVIDRSVHIANVPYVTDDREQLEKEFETYFQRVMGKKLQRLSCGIEGDLTKAVAVFQAVEGECM